MATQDQSSSQLKEVLGKYTAGVICIPEDPSTDTVAAATALYIGLTKLGKNVSLVSSAPSLKSNLIASEKITNGLSTSGNNLVIAIPFKDPETDAILVDKVDYFTEGNYVNIVVTPPSDAPKFNPKQVKYSHTGGSIEFVVTIDVPTLKSLGAVYSENQEQFKGKNIVNVDRHLTNSFFGRVNVVGKTSSSTSELIFKILRELRCEIDKDIATNLYAGLAAATNNFTSYSVNPETFETAASLLKFGAEKKSQKPNNSSKSVGFERKGYKPISQIESEPQADEGAVFNDDEEDADWLKPKIFRDNDLL